MKYFTIEESMAYSGKYMLAPKHDKLPLTYTTGSYNILPARLLGLHYADYLRYCRDTVAAELIGKNSNYVVPYFSDKTKLAQLIAELDSRVEKILKK
jgi:hypothetical protein